MILKIRCEACDVQLAEVHNQGQVIEEIYAEEMSLMMSCDMGHNPLIYILEEDLIESLAFNEPVVTSSGNFIWSIVENLFGVS